MALADVPAVLILVGIAAYIVLAGADFGAGLWYLLAGPGPRGRRVRDFTYHAMAPVWEANHVWLIFVLVVTWTAYPTAFGSIASTVAVPLFIAAVGIILRGTAYAMRSGAPADRESEGAVGFLFGASSVLTPFALGAAIGGIASGRVPVGNAAGDLTTSWLNPTSITIGALAVATSGYLAAVYLAGDATRSANPELAHAFQLRALVMGLVSGVLAVAGLLVLRSDARALFDDLTSGAGLIAVLVSAGAGGLTLALVRSARYEPARVSAALAVVALVAGWGVAQSPDILPGLTVRAAAASHSALVALVISIAAGLVVLVPALVLLYRLVLRGRFDEPVPAVEERPVRRAETSQRSVAGVAISLFVVGATLTFLGEGVVLAIGVIALAAVVVVGVAELLRPEVLAWAAGTPGDGRNAVSASNQGSPDAKAALARRK
jgi:cytochrome bd ubiquinol oxidase subunit II